MRRLQLNLNLCTNVSVAGVHFRTSGEKTGCFAASAFSFRCTDCTAGATCNKWRPDLIVQEPFVLAFQKYFNIGSFDFWHCLVQLTVCSRYSCSEEHYPDFCEFITHVVNGFHL